MSNLLEFIKAAGEVGGAVLAGLACYSGYTFIDGFLETSLSTPKRATKVSRKYKTSSLS